ncbi:type VII secretion target [Actinokineospora inagensis]|uniref:type VII secretion target n=1 Tax=Actinokineospora inagensis TaxID=103730 RepID=UPI0003FF2AA4|nr:type VII secretion target [Actinokineospora inagensis]
MTDGFEVDLDELDRLARRLGGLGDEVRGDVAWRYGVDAEKWPADDPIGAAVVVYLRSLAEARDRLCRRLADTATDLTNTAAAYRDVDDAGWREGLGDG